MAVPTVGLRSWKRCTAAAGFNYAQGETIVTLDADLQNDPADIPLLLSKLAEGYDVVAGWRKNRKDNIVRRIPSVLANWLIARTTGVHLHDTGCSLRAYRAEVPVNHRPRTQGVAKYGRFGLDRSFRVILDLVTVYFLLGFFGRPMHLFGGVGLISGTLGVIIGLYLSAVKVFTGQDIGDRPLLLLAVLLAIIGVQFLAMGLLGEILVRTYYESQDKPTYHVRTVLSRDR